jgi:hypothetical protein
VTEFNSRTQGQKKGVNWLTQIKRQKNWQWRYNNS